MLSPLLVLAEATALAPEPAAGHHSALDQVTQITSAFGLNWPGFFAQVVSFSVVGYVLWRFAFKPVLATLDERQRKISSGLRYAEEMKAKLDASLAEHAALLRQGQVDATRIIDEARKTAKDYLDRQTQETSARANEMLVKAQQAIELEHKKMLADARLEIARLVVTTTQRVLAKELSDAERRRYNEAAARELAGV